MIGHTIVNVAVSGVRLPRAILLCSAFMMLSCVMPSQLSAQVTDEDIEASIKRAQDFLLNHNAEQGSGESGIGVVALLKSGIQPDNDKLKQSLGRILRCCRDGNFTPVKGKDSTYEASVFLMALANSDIMLEEKGKDRKYDEQIKVLLNWIVTEQRANGAWDYPNHHNGDTSQTQYALLALWDAKRAGYEVDVAVFQRAVDWHVTRQVADGGFAYKPKPKPQEGSRHSLTAGGIGSLLICRLFMFPDAKDSAVAIKGGASRAAKEENKETKKFGILEDAEVIEATVEVSENTSQPAVKNASLRAIHNSAGKALKWLDVRFTVGDPKPTGWPIYYLYSLERAMALAKQPDEDKLGHHEWFYDGAAHLISIQNENGSWNSKGGGVVGTSFGLMFMARATGKTLGHRRKASRSGGGLLMAGRGLPENPGDIITSGGKVKKQKMTGPVDDLIKILENPSNADFLRAQEALVDKVTTGDARALVGRKDQLLPLAASPNAEVRRTAMWALGRSHDITVVPTLIEGLDDPNFDVVVEARNALRFISKQIEGYGLPSQPSKAQRKKAIRSWKKWYLTVRPYDERDDLINAR